MAQFEYGSALGMLMVPEVVSALGDVRELKGKTASLSATNPETFSALVEVAKIQSTGASNRIENISTSDRRLRELMADKTDPRNRDEREIAGYRYVLDEIHESHDNIPVTPNIILQLHRALYRFSCDSYAGRWKDADNVIAERTAEGELATPIRPHLCRRHSRRRRKDLLRIFEADRRQGIRPLARVACLHLRLR